MNTKNVDPKEKAADDAGAENTEAATPAGTDNAAAETKDEAKESEEG